MKVRLIFLSFCLKDKSLKNPKRLKDRKSFDVDLIKKFSSCELIMETSERYFRKMSSTFPSSNLPTQGSLGCEAAWHRGSIRVTYQIGTSSNPEVKKKRIGSSDPSKDSIKSEPNSHLGCKATAQLNSRIKIFLKNYGMEAGLAVI